MRTVDTAEMLLSSFGSVRKTVKWHEKLISHSGDGSFKFLLQIKQQQENNFTGRFLAQIDCSLLENYHVDKTSNQKHVALSSDLLPRLTERYFLLYIPPTEKKTNPTSHCHVCSNMKRGLKEKKEFRYMCAKSNIVIVLCHVLRNIIL